MEVFLARRISGRWKRCGRSWLASNFQVPHTDVHNRGGWIMGVARMQEAACGNSTDGTHGKRREKEGGLASTRLLLPDRG